MAQIELLSEEAAPLLAVRIAEQLGRHAQDNPFISPTFDVGQLTEALRQARAETLVAVEDGRIIGHLYGAYLTNDLHGAGVWVGPDGASFDSGEILTDLYLRADERWRARGGFDQYVWALDDAATSAAWLALGFARAHQRGVLSLNAPRDVSLPAGYGVRRAMPTDIEACLVLDQVIDEANEQITHAGANNADNQRADLLDSLEDPEVHFYVVEHEGNIVAQCMTYPLLTRRGSFDQTLHLSSVATLPNHQRRGLATAVVNTALTNAFLAGFEYCETNWRVTNERASTYWINYGFHSTYVRLHRRTTA